MYHERSSDWGFGSALALCLVLGLLGAFLLVKAVMLIIHTLVKYPRKRVLWAFLAGFVLSLVVGGLLTFIYQNGAWLSFGIAGFLALVLVAYIVELQNSQTLLKQPDSVVQAVLHTNWFGETHDAQAA